MSPDMLVQIFYVFAVLHVYYLIASSNLKIKPPASWSIVLSYSCRIETFCFLRLVAYAKLFCSYKRCYAASPVCVELRHQLSAISVYTSKVAV